MKKKRQEEENEKKKRKRRGPSVSTIVLVVILLAGLAIFLYPTISDRWNAYHQSRAIASYVEAVDDMSEEERKAMLEAARDYNERLARRGMNFVLTEEEEERYESLLDVSGTGIMGYIEIPSIDIRFPVYHGTDEGILQIAIGHIAGSSLPIGGESTHSVLSGHRGLPSAKLFSDLDELKEHDTFMITVLGETAVYQVDQIRIVLPEEVDGLAIEEGEDYCTLVTCTPYGINTHRILVRGRRIANENTEFQVKAEAVKYPSYLVALAIGIPMLFLILLILVLYYRIRRPGKSGEKLLEALKGQGEKVEKGGRKEKRRRRKKGKKEEIEEETEKIHDK